MTDTVSEASIGPSARRRASLGALARIHEWGKRQLGRAWPLHYVGPPFPGVIAHHRPPGISGFFRGHEGPFHRATLVEGEEASRYFGASGIRECAEKNGGLCSFRMGTRIALYQSQNISLLSEEDLAPSLDLNKDLFGEFMGSLPNEDPSRRAKRRAIEATLGSAKFIDDLEPAIREQSRHFLAGVVGKEVPLDEFTLCLVAHVDSFVPGVLDLRLKPLTYYLTSTEYGRVARAFFEIASDVISNVDSGAAKDFDMIVPFIRTLLRDNFDSLSSATATNLVRRQFALWRKPFTRERIDRLEASKVKELGTIIVATYDTTCLSLLWTLAYVESDPELKRRVTAEARLLRPSEGGLSLLDFVVLEAVRLGGSNPTALWRRVVRPFRLRHRDQETTVPAGAMIWLDRRFANRDPAVFPRPCRFDVENIRAITKSKRESISSILSRGRYEINSFSMINSDRNPRKCPGRLFSVRIQSILLREIYSAYDVATEGIDLRLKRHSSMPRPRTPGTIRITQPTGTMP